MHIKEKRQTSRLFRFSVFAFVILFIVYNVRKQIALGDGTKKASGDKQIEAVLNKQDAKSTAPKNPLSRKAKIISDKANDLYAKTARLFARGIAAILQDEGNEKKVNLKQAILKYKSPAWCVDGSTPYSNYFSDIYDSKRKLVRISKKLEKYKHEDESLEKLNDDIENLMLALIVLSEVVASEDQYLQEKQIRAIRDEVRSQNYYNNLFNNNSRYRY